MVVVARKPVKPAADISPSSSSGTPPSAAMQDSGAEAAAAATQPDAKVSGNGEVKAE
jgi:hypothetical protein